MVPHTFSEKVSIGGLALLMKEAIRTLPAIEHASFERTWAGIRPQTGDGLPFLGKHPTIPNLFIATGHYRNGILLSPITGKLVAGMINEWKLPDYIRAFGLDRIQIPSMR
jgi:glycine oxidase